jgi:hypothetical protein
MDCQPKSRNAVEKIFGKLFVTQTKKNLALLLRGRIVVVQSLRFDHNNVRLIVSTTTEVS